jgi:hypothetical protein
VPEADEQEIPIAIATVNAAYATPWEWQTAAGGMMNPVEVKVLPAMELYRFASAAESHTWYAAAWWFGKSAYDGLLQYAKSSNESLSRAARRCLAVPPPSTMDVLISVRVLQPLSAWSGTPKTLRLKDSRGRYGDRQEPDRAITQLYIPGLDPRKTQGKCLPWHEAFAGGPRFLSRVS